MLLGAALQCQRNKDQNPTIARPEQEFGLPAVILLRLENAQKIAPALERCNAWLAVPTVLEQGHHKAIRSAHRA
jgi:ubiquinone biosynthesis protein COQ9